MLVFGGRLLAQPGNDSVFNPARIAAVVLTQGREGHATSLKEAMNSGKPGLFIFLSPECPICRNYTKALNEICAKYAPGVRFYGIIPGRTYSSAVVDSFALKYRIAFPLYIDQTLALTRYLRASATPEVILLNDRQRLAYKGAIDNWFSDIGSSRSRATKHFLEDALREQLNGERITLKRTKAIGCSINDY